MLWRFPWRTDNRIFYNLLLQQMFGRYDTKMLFPSMVPEPTEKGNHNATVYLFSSIQDDNYKITNAGVVLKKRQ